MRFTVRPKPFFVFVACLGIWLPQNYGAVLVNLDATGLPEGPLPTWPNQGTLEDFESAGPVIPEVTTIGGVRGVSFIGGTTGANGTHYIGPPAPFEVTSVNSRTIEAWVYNPSIQDEETVFAWGRRGGPDGSNLSFNHSVHPTFGAVGHWGAGPDMGWDGNLAFGRWTYIAYTFDFFTYDATVYFDGEVASSETMPATFETWAWDNTAEANPLPFRVARQNNADGTPSGVGVGEITIARIRVHDEALTPEQIQSTFEEESAFFGLLDSDGDGMPDWFENLYEFLDPNDPSDAALDFDGDGLTNLEEFLLGTDPGNPDTDGDGLSDGDEVNVYFTDPLNPDTDGDGLTDGDEVHIYQTDPLNPDTDGDGFSDFQEVVHGSDPNDPASVPAFTEPIVFLDAANLEPGPLAVWPNQGLLEGDFLAPAGAVPSIETIQGMNGVSLNGASHYFTGPAAPPFVGGNNSRSVEAWILNPQTADEETVFAWARRGGPDGTNVSFNHGTNPTFGAVGHWGAGPDVGWAGEIVAGQWTYIAYTYDGPNLTTSVYKDGALANWEEHAAPMNAWTVDTAGNPLPFRVASQNDAGGAPTAALRGSMTIARIRVHDRVLSETDIANTYEQERVLFGLLDSDGDGLPDWYERLYDFLDPNNPDDAALDFDNDGLTNLEEFFLGTDPANPDTDGDGLLDGEEVALGTDPLNPDTDNDGLLDGEEVALGTDPLNPDSDFDGYPDGQEVFHGSDPLDAASVPDFSTPLAMVDLDATELPLGLLDEWPNLGALGGVFLASEEVPSVENVAGVNGVTFNGTDHYFTGRSAPLFLTGNSARTIEAWVFNPAAADEETVFAWGRRGGPDGTNMSFNHGVNATWGAVGHWGAPDIGWEGQVAEGQWTHIAYTYDPVLQTGTVYADGAMASSEVFSAPLDTWEVDNTPAARTLPFRVAAQNEAGGSATPTLRGSMTIAKVRVYDQALTAEAIAASFEEGLGVSERPLITSVQIDPQTQAVTFTWTPAPGTSYAVEASGDLETWTAIATGLTEGGFSELPDLGPGEARFYRLRIE